MAWKILDKLDVLIKGGFYPNREALLDEAFRALLRSKPELRRKLAIELYRNSEISFSRAAEIGGLDLEDFKEVLKESGIEREIPPVGEEISQETADILKRTA